MLEEVRGAFQKLKPVVETLLGVTEDRLTWNLDVTEQDTTLSVRLEILVDGKDLDVTQEQIVISLLKETGFQGMTWMPIRGMA
jgi:hypothetical protein